MRTLSYWKPKHFSESIHRLCAYGNGKYGRIIYYWKDNKWIKSVGTCERDLISWEYLKMSEEEVMIELL